MIKIVILKVINDTPNLNKNKKNYMPKRKFINKKEKLHKKV